MSTHALFSNNRTTCKTRKKIMSPKFQEWRQDRKEAKELFIPVCQRYNGHAEESSDKGGTSCLYVHHDWTNWWRSGGDTWWFVIVCARKTVSDDCFLYWQEWYFWQHPIKLFYGSCLYARTQRLGNQWKRFYIAFVCKSK